MSTASQQEPEQQADSVSSSAPLQRRHSIHSTSPTSTDGLPLPEEATEPAPSDGANAEEQDRPAAGASQPSGLASFDSLYSAINSVPVEAHQYPYYPIGGPSATYPAAAPSQFASEWGSPPPPQRHLGGGGRSLQHPPLYPVPGRGDKRTGKCKFFNALKGFGFIIDHHGEELGNDVEVFVHYTAIESIQTGRGGFRSLLEGEEVEYTIMQGPKGWQAQSVTGPNGMPCIGSPSNSHMNKNLGPAPDGYQRKFSVGSMGSDDFRSYGSGGGYSSKRNGRGGTDSGYYSSAMTSPAQTPHQLYSPPHYPSYSHPSPHASYGPPPVGIPLALHHGNAYSFLPPPPPPHALLTNPDGTSPTGGTLLLPNINPSTQPEEADPNSPYRPLPPSAFYQPGPPPPLRGAPGGPPMQGYYTISNGGGAGQGYYPPPAGYEGFVPQHALAGLPSPGQPYPLPLPTGMGAVGGWAENPAEQDEFEGETAVGATSEGVVAEAEATPAPPAPSAMAA